MSRTPPNVLGTVTLGAGDDARTLTLLDDWTWEVTPGDPDLEALLPLLVTDDLRSPAAGQPGHAALAHIAEALGGKAKLPRVNSRKGRIY